MEAGMSCASFTIALEDLRFYSRIGVADQERLVGNDFRVDVSLAYCADGFRSEDLTTTVSYADLFAIVEEVMAREWLLLESATEAVASKVTERWGALVMALSVKLTKITPPIPGMQGSASVTLTIDKTKKDAI